MTRILLTGFEPFGHDRTNPSADAVAALAAGWTGPERLRTEILPVSFAGAARELARLLQEEDPDLVIATGLAGGRQRVGVERVAVNLADARIPDNDGAQPVDVPSLPGAPAALFTTLPVKAISAAAAAAGLPVELSLSAGSFVCNHVFLHAEDWARRNRRRAGFVHVPWSSETVPSPELPSLALDEIVAALALVVRTSVDVDEDVVAAGGALH